MTFSEYFLLGTVADVCSKYSGSRHFPAGVGQEGCRGLEGKDENLGRRLSVVSVKQGIRFRIATALYIGLGLPNITALAAITTTTWHYPAVVHRLKHIDNMLIRRDVDDFAFENTHNYVQIAKIERFVASFSIDS